MGRRIRQAVTHEALQLSTPSLPACIPQQSAEQSIGASRIHATEDGKGSVQHQHLIVLFVLHYCKQEK